MMLWRWRVLRPLFLALCLLGGLLSQQAWAVVVVAHVTGSILGPDASPLANTQIIFNSLTSQTVQSQVVGPIIIDTQTDASGAIDVSLIQGLYLQVTMGLSAPFTVIVPASATVSWADLVTNTQLPNGGISITGVAGGIPYFPTTSTVAASGLLTQHAPLVGGGASGVPHTVSVGTLGQALISGGTSADPSWFAPEAGSVLFAGTAGALASRHDRFFWDDTTRSLCVGCVDTTAGGLVNTRVMLQKADGGSGVVLAAMSQSQEPRFTLDTITGGGFVFSDYNSGSWHVGLAQVGGRIGVGIISPTTGIDDRAGAFFSGVQFQTVAVDPTFGPLDSGNTASLKLQELSVNGTNAVGFRAPAVVATNVIWTLPAADGLPGQVLATNGSGTLSWATAGGGGGNMSNPLTTTGDLLYASSTATPATPARLGIGTAGQCLVVSGGLPAWGACAGTAAAAGATTQVQFNNAGSFGADAAFVWDNTGKALTISAVNTGTMVPLAVRNTSSGNAAVVEVRLGNDTQANALIANVFSSTTPGEGGHAHILQRLSAPLFLGSYNTYQLRLDDTGVKVRDGAFQVTSAPSLSATPTGEGPSALSAVVMQGAIGGATQVYYSSVGTLCTSTAGCVGQYVGVDTGATSGFSRALKTRLTMEATVPNASAMWGQEFTLTNLRSHRGDTDGAAGLAEAGLGAAYGAVIVGDGTFRSTAALTLAGASLWNRGIAIPAGAVLQSSFADYGNPAKSIDIRGVPTYGVYQSDAAPLNYFNGNMGLGVASPGFPLEINAAVAEYQIGLRENGTLKARLATLPTSGSVFAVYDEAAAKIRWGIDLAGNVLAGDPAAGRNIRLTPAAHIEATNVTGSPPGLSGCGAGATIVGTDMAGLVTVGTGPGTCVVTFATAWGSRPHCAINNDQRAARLSTVTTTAMTMNIVVAGDKADYVCFSHY